jgi:hypothetical protein
MDRRLRQLRTRRQRRGGSLLEYRFFVPAKDGALRAALTSYRDVMTQNPPVSACSKSGTIRRPERSF